MLDLQVIIARLSTYLYPIFIVDNKILRKNCLFLSIQLSSTFSLFQYNVNKIKYIYFDSKTSY